MEREGLSIRHASRFILIGSGNPEEGELRPQLLDRFGLSVEVLTPDTVDERIEVIKRRDDYDKTLRICRNLGQRKQKTQEQNPKSQKKPSFNYCDSKILEHCAQICIDLGSDGLRGELTLVRTARALAAFNGKDGGSRKYKTIAPMALSHRREEIRLTTQAQEQGSRDQFKKL